MINLNEIYNEDCFVGLEKIPKNSIKLVITDPPFFNPAAHYISRDKSKAKRCYGDMSIMMHSFKLLASKMSEILTPDGHVLIFCDCVTYPAFFEAFYDYFEYTRALIWYKGKNYFSLGKGAWRYSYEMVLHSFNSNQFYVQLNRQDVLECKVVPQEDRGHQAEKPLQLIQELISAVTKEGDIVLDPFAGSGTFAVACKQLNRKYLGFEINSDYLEIADNKINNWKRQTKIMEG